MVFLMNFILMLIGVGLVFAGIEWLLEWPFWWHSLGQFGVVAVIRAALASIAGD